MRRRSDDDDDAPPSKKRQRRREDVDDDEDEDDRPRKKKKRKSGAGTVIVISVLIVILLGAAGVGAWFLFGKKAGTPDAAKMGDRFLGNWEGASPDRPTVKLTMQVTHDRIHMRTVNAKTLEFTWHPVREAGNTLVVHRVSVASKQGLDWSVAFTSDDAIRVTALHNGAAIANLRRVGK